MEPTPPPADPEVDAVLLAAGRGTRLHPLTERTPKPALPVLDVPLAAYGLAALLAARRDVVVNVSRNGSDVSGALDAAGFGGRYSVFHEGEPPIGTANTLRSLAPRLATEVVTYNADAVTDVDVDALLAAHRAAGAAITMAVAMVDEGADFVVEGGRAVTLIDRSAAPRAPGARFIGMMAIEKQALAVMGEEPGIAEALLRPAVARREAAVVVHHGYAADVGTIARYVDTIVAVLKGVAPRPPAPVPGRFVSVPGGLAYVGPGVAIGEGVRLLAGAAVGAGARIGRDAWVKDAIVWPGAFVPPETGVERAVWAGRLLT